MTHPFAALALRVRTSALLGAALLLVPACDDTKAAEATKGPEMVESIDGKATVGGKDAKITSCKAVGKKVGVAVELGLDTGITIVSDQMEGTSIRKADGTSSKPDCDRTTVSSGGSSSLGAGSWWQGELGLTCKHEGVEIVLDAKLDCGAKDRPSNRVADKKTGG